jgi:hypothetical protein
MNGFIVMGCMNGVFDSNTMTYPTATFIKQGLISTNVPLFAVKMIYAIQNYNVTVAIKKEHYKTFLNKAIKHYEALEEYAKCSELVTLKSRL